MPGSFVFAKQPDGKIRVTYAGWEDMGVVLGRTGAVHSAQRQGAYSA